jgi:nucleoside-diphosphate kinase
MRERTLVLIKPDGVSRRLIGEVIRRFEAKGLDIVGMKMLRFDATLTQAHYGQYAAQAFYPSLSEFIQSGPSVALVVEGNDAIALVRKMMGATRHTDAEPGTIRGDFAHDTTCNIVHGSDSPETAEREIPLFFHEAEILG